MTTDSFDSITAEIEALIKTCPACESPNISEREETSEMAYGLGTPVMLSVTEPVLRCGDCGQAWTDYRSEVIRQVTIDNHLQSIQNCKDEHHGHNRGPADR